MTNEEVIKDLKRLRAFQQGRYAPAIDKAIEALENKPDYDIIFLCDGKACGENHDCMECRHTLDIRHAKNFHLIWPNNPILFDKNYYLEVENGQSNCSSDRSDA